MSVSDGLLADRLWFEFPNLERSTVEKEVVFWREVLGPHLVSPEVLTRSIITASRSQLQHHGEAPQAVSTMHRRRAHD